VIVKDAREGFPGQDGEAVQPSFQADRMYLVLLSGRMAREPEGATLAGPVAGSDWFSSSSVILLRLSGPQFVTSQARVQESPGPRCVLLAVNETIFGGAGG
jgi:hypothetical protein